MVFGRTVFGAVMAALTAVSAMAGPDRVSILLASHHVNATQGFEEINPGLFLTWTGVAWKERLDLGLGAYRNSYGHGSLAATAAVPLVRKESWGLELFGALAWYPGDGDKFRHAMGDVVPLAGLQARYRTLFVQAIPSSGTSTDGVLSFGLTFPLD